MTLQQTIDEQDKKLEEVANGLFLHGKETPDQSYNLPEGQYTVQETIEYIHQRDQAIIEAVVIQAHDALVKTLVKKGVGDLFDMVEIGNELEKSLKERLEKR